MFLGKLWYVAKSLHIPFEDFNFDNTGNERAKLIHCYKKKRMTVNYKNLKYRIESKAFSKSVPGA